MLLLLPGGAELCLNNNRLNKAHHGALFFPLKPTQRVITPKNMSVGRAKLTFQTSDSQAVTIKVEMDRLARLPIGKTTFQSMIRRHVLWAVLNVAVSVSLYFVVKCVARLVYAQYGASVPVVQPLELSIYLVMSILLLVYIYHAYIADGARFGGTNLTMHRVRAMLMKVVVPGLLGAFCGKSLLSLLQWAPVTSLSIVTFSMKSHLVPSISGAVALVIFFSCPSSPQALQSTPQPVASSFVRQILTSTRSAVLLGFKIAATVSLTLCVLRALENVWLRWTCNAALSASTQSSPLCSLYALNSSLSVYMPESSIVVDGGVSLFVAVVLLFQVELLLQSLSFMSTYPLDFQKLRWQLLRAQGGSARAGETPSEQLLLQALLIGQDTTVNTSSGVLDPLSHGSSNYSENTALSEAQVQQLRQARLVDSVVSVGMQPPVVPYFGEGANLLPVTPVHRKFPINVAHLGQISDDSLVNTVGAAGAGMSAESREALRVGKFDLLARSLAFQDLHRLVQDPSEVAVQRRAVLFAKHWAQILAATCGMIDAAALQVHLLDEFLTKREENEDLLLDDLDQDNGLFKSDGNVKVTDNVAAGAAPRHSSSFENILRLRASLAAGERDASHAGPSYEEKHYDSSIERDPSGLRARTMYRRDKNRHAHHDGTASEAFKHAQDVLQASQFLKGLQEWVYLGFYGALQVPVPGYGVEYAADLPARAFPPMCTTSVVHAIESIAALLLLALSEDASGYTQRSVCPVVRSLLTLESSLAAYCSTLQASQFVRISSMGRIQQIRYRARSERAIPDAIRLLQGAVQQALHSMVRAYRDVLLIVVTHYDSQATTALFSRTQVTALEAKLMAAV